VVAIKDPAADPSTEYGDTNFVFKMATGFEKAKFLLAAHMTIRGYRCQAVATNNDPPIRFCSATVR
jgi:hypothetical protein